MKKLKQIEQEIIILGYYQLIGGILGIGFAIYALAGGTATNLNSVGSTIMILIMGLLFLFSIYAGNLCLNNNKNQLFISKINQALQAISFNLGGIGFAYHAGVYFGVGFDITEGFLFISNLGLSTSYLRLSSSSETSIILVNLVAFYLVYRIGNYENTIEFEKEKMKKLGINLNDHLII